MFIIIVISISYSTHKIFRADQSIRRSLSLRLSLLITSHSVCVRL